MDFKESLETLFTEKGLMDERMVLNHGDQTHIMDIPFMIEYLSTLPKNQKARIQHNFMMIDYQNGNIMHFMNYLAQSYLKVTFPCYV